MSEQEITEIVIPAGKKCERKQGHLSNNEREIIDAMVIKQPDTPAEQLGAGLATMLNRTPETMVKYVQATRDKLAGHLPRYAEIHMQVVEEALKKGELGEARLGAQWALEKGSVKDDKGNIVRVIDAPIPTEGAGATAAPSYTLNFAVACLPKKDS